MRLDSVDACPTSCAAWTNQFGRCSSRVYTSATLNIGCHGGGCIYTSTGSTLRGPLMSVRSQKLIAKVHLCCTVGRVDPPLSTSQTRDMPRANHRGYSFLAPHPLFTCPGSISPDAPRARLDGFLMTRRLIR